MTDQPTPLWMRVALRLGVVAAACAITLQGVGDGGGFRFTDDSRHAMSGAFLLDMAMERGFEDPVPYSEAYYARYPSLCIPYYSPPFFHAVEAGFFGLFGVSVATARATVLAFHVLAVLFLFSIVERALGSVAAAFAAIFFASFPLVAAWSRNVVLEPAATCMVLLSTWLLLRVEDRPSKLGATFWGLSLLAGLATKQTTAFIVPVHLAYIASRPALRPGLTGIAALAVSALLCVVLLAAFSSPYQLAAVTLGAFAPDRILEHLASYPSQLPYTVGWPALAAGAGMLAALFRPSRFDVLFALWILGFLAMMLFVSRSVPRYSFLAMPAVAYYAVRGLSAGALLIAPRAAVPAAVAIGSLLVAAPNLAEAFTHPPPLVDGYDEAAAYVVELEGDRPILFDGYWDGDFIFFCRQLDPRRRHVLRGSKVLYNFASFKWKDYQSFVSKPDDILDLLKRYGVRYVIVEDVDQIDTPPGGMLRELVRTGPFRRLKRFPITVRDVRLTARHLDVYEFLDAREPSGEPLEIYLPGIQRGIRVPMEASAPADGGSAAAIERKRGG